MTPNDMTSSNPGPKQYSIEEMEQMWPSAAGELRGFANHLDSRNAGITAAQMRMAVQMAGLYLLCLKHKQLIVPDLEHEKVIGPEVPTIGETE